MTATDKVKNERNMIGAKKVSVLFFRGKVTKCIIVTPSKMYTQAQKALIRGLLDIFNYRTSMLALWNDYRTKSSPVGIVLG